MTCNSNYEFLFCVIRVYLVGSTPGRYVGPDMERWGHLRLRKVKKKNNNNNFSSFVGQYVALEKFTQLFKAMQHHLLFILILYGWQCFNKSCVSLRVAGRMCVYVCAAALQVPLSFPLGIVVAMTDSWEAELEPRLLTFHDRPLLADTADARSEIWHYFCWHPTQWR